MEPLPATYAELLLRLRIAEAEALIAEVEPVIAHYASIEAQLNAQNPAPPPEPANSPPAGLPTPLGTAADAGPGRS